MGRRLLSAGAVVLALAAGCSTSNADPGPADLAALNAGAQKYAQLTDALNQLYDKCMAGKGFTVHPRHEPTDPTTFVITKPPVDRPENLGQARKYGYGINTPLPSESDDAAVRPDPFDTQPEEVRQAYSAGLTGPGNLNRNERRVSGEKERAFFVMPDGNKQAVFTKGCQPETDRAVFGDVEHAVELRYTATSGLDRAVYTAAATDPDVNEARGAWISCMAGKGYPGMTDTVDAARKADGYYRNIDPSSQEAVLRAQDKEIAQAVAHAECADQTEFTEKLATAWNRALSDYLAGHEADLVAWRESSETALTKARNMLAG
jgi:hypothetical protein